MNEVQDHDSVLVTEETLNLAEEFPYLGTEMCEIDEQLESVAAVVVCGYKKQSKLSVCWSSYLVHNLTTTIVSSSDFFVTIWDICH